MALLQLKLIELLGDGAHADVWKGIDSLDREVAVKIVRPAAGGVANVMDQAKALARANHPNVVTVHYVGTVVEPGSGEEVDCVVMELIRGVTLTERLSGSKFTLSELKVIGREMINGLDYIHSQGMVHGDLHTDNIMLSGGRVKIIDILYRKSLNLLSTAPRNQNIRKDLLSLRLLLQEIISHSELDPAEATEFNSLLTGDAGIEEIRGALDRVTDVAYTANAARQVEHAFRRITDLGFVAEEEYAVALAEETPRRLVAPLLDRIIKENAYRRIHYRYVQLLWAKLSAREKTEVLNSLNDAAGDVTPTGAWGSPIGMLAALGEEGWVALSKVTKLRLESQIINDVLSGRVNIHAATQLSGGVLGTYATVFYEYFTIQGLDRLVENIIAMLRQSWFTQNYIGTYFMGQLHGIASLAFKSDEMIEALAIAMQNDARRVKSNRHLLPPQWVDRLTSPRGSLPEAKENNQLR